MAKTSFIKPGKVVIVLAGRYAGRKAIVVKTADDGSDKHKFGHCLVAGIDKAPLRVTRAMTQKKIVKRSRIKPFVKYINYNHIMPTRYNVNDLDVKSCVNPESMQKADTRTSSRKELKKMLEAKYITRGKNSSAIKYFYSKLRF